MAIKFRDTNVDFKTIPLTKEILNSLYVDDYLLNRKFNKRVEDALHSWNLSKSSGTLQNKSKHLRPAIDSITGKTNAGEVCN